jgi:hypothetical protein
MAEENQTPEGDDGAKPEDNGLGDAGKKALDAERSARRKAEKEATDLKTRLQSLEDEGKSEVDKLRSQVATLTKDAEAATAKSVRMEVAAAKGLTLAQARRLVGTTKDELEADADELVADLGLKKGEGKDDTPIEDTTEGKPAGGTGTPKEDLKSGAANADDETVDPAKLAATILSRPF